MRLEVSGLCKSFAVPVLKDVNFELMRGSVHGLVGENGAGKSTLINILTGLLVADEGRICIEGSRFKPSCVKDALDAGVSVAAQELSLIENLSVGENILLKALPSAWFGLNGNKITTQSRDLLELVGLGQLDPNKRVSELSLAEKQLVELAKALSSDSRILILDEPTSALTGPQADTLHQILRERAEKGLSVIYISHRLSDVLRVCDTVSV
ncbi:MAG TPA: sugar ABC transporter ATP-binding protein, partial [Gammaproteobacteria bacterium]|nr:sugar ABC transporter ATP-binding protein [Gammaproteobacteria bacterium]